MSAWVAGKRTARTPLLKFLEIYSVRGHPASVTPPSVRSAPSSYALQKFQLGRAAVRFAGVPCPARLCGEPQGRAPACVRGGQKTQGYGLYPISIRTFRQPLQQDSQHVAVQCICGGGTKDCWDGCNSVSFQKHFHGASAEPGMATPTGSPNDVATGRAATDSGQFSPDVRPLFQQLTPSSNTTVYSQFQENHDRAITQN